jgi:hypothetical protein
MRERNYGSEDDQCLDRNSLYTDRRCLVGIRPLEGGDGDGPEMRMKRLIDGAPSLMDMVWETETEGPPRDGLSEQPDEIDAITAARKRRENAMKKLDYGSEDDWCQDRNSLYTDRSCLVGIRPLAEGDGDGPEMRLKRLIDGVPAVHPPR